MVRTTRGGSAAVACIAVLLAAPPRLRADSEATWLTGTQATGSWGGVRPSLAARGLELAVVYTADVSRGLASDEQDSGQLRYQALLDAWLELDTQRMGAWAGGKFVVGFQNVHGSGRSQTLRSFQVLSNIDVPPMSQLSEWFYQHHLAGGRFWFRLGKQDTNSDFGTPRYPGNFINNTFGAIPTVPMPSYPAPALGALVGVLPFERLQVRAGIFDGGEQPGRFGEGTAFDGEDDGLFAVVAVELTTSAGAHERPAGSRALGAWRHTGDRHVAPNPDAVGSSDRDTPASAGLFLVLDQRIFEQPDDPDNGAGLHLFARTAVTHADGAELSAYVGAGVAYHAPWSRRPDDTCGIGFGAVWMERPGGGSARETFVEIFYKARLTHFFSLHPDVQYLASPAGNPGHAVAATLRLRVKL